MSKEQTHRNMTFKWVSKCGKIHKKIRWDRYKIDFSLALALEVKYDK